MKHFRKWLLRRRIKRAQSLILKIKENNILGNLILLCNKHHNQTKQGDKDHWIEYYQAIQEARWINSCA